MVKMHFFLTVKIINSVKIATTFKEILSGQTLLAIMKHTGVLATSDFLLGY